MPRHASNDLKARIPFLFDEGYSVRDICYLLGFKKTVAHDVLNRHQRFGTVSDRVSERDEFSRALYMNRIAEAVPDPNMYMFVDAADECAKPRRRGRSGNGLRRSAQRRFIQGRYSIIPVVTLDGVIAYDIVEGAVDTKRFIRFLKEQVMPFTNPYPGPRSVLITDDRHVHRGEDIRRLVEDDHLCKLMYLPSRSPDYNPAERAFSAIETHLCYYADDSPLMSMVHACQSITPDQAERYFRASGYIA